MNDARRSWQGRDRRLHAEQLLERRVEERTRELTALLEVSRNLASTLELDSLLDVVLEQLKVVADYRAAAISIVADDKLHELRRRTREGDTPPTREVSLVHAAGWWEPVARGEPVIIDDVQSEEPLAGAYRTTARHAQNATPLYTVHGFMAVPLTVKDRVMGTIVLSHEQPGFYTERHAALATAIASQAAIALGNARLLADSEQRTRELSALLGAAGSLASTLELEPLLDVILDQIQVVAESDGALISTLENGRIRIIRRRAPAPIDPTNEQVQGVDPVKAGAIWTQLQRGEPVIIGDVRGDEPLAQAYRALHSVPIDTAHLSHVRSWMAVPLLVKEGMIGFISLMRGEPNTYTAHHAQLVLALATQAAAAIENARLYGEAQKLAALEERQRLARELHDSVSQALFGIALGAGAARRRLDLDPSRVGESLDYVLSLADVALTEMRALIFELRPEALEKDGLVAALTRHAAATHARHEIAVQMALCEEPNVPLAIKEALYRIAQEAMHNAVKHARATRIELVLATKPDGIALEVRDDGIGFDPSQDFAGHLGLHSMRERMAGVGGTTDITSAPGEGSCIHAAVPCR